MTLLKNTFEGGTNGAGLTAGSGGNTGGASGDFFNAVTATAGTVTFSTSAAMVGSLGVAFTQDATTSTAQLVRWSGTNYTVAYMRAYVKFPTLPAANFIFMRAQRTSVNRALIRMSSTGNIQLADSAGTLRYTSTKAFTANEAFRIETHFAFDATNGHMEARLFWGANLNGTTPDETVGVFTDNWNLGGPDADFFDYGNLTNGTGTTRYMDALGFSDTTWVGPAVTANPVTHVAPGVTFTGGSHTANHGTPSGLWTENAEGGTDEQVVSTSTTGFTFVTIDAGAAFVHDTAYKVEGSKSFRLLLPAGNFNAYGRKDIVGAPTTLYTRIHLRTDATTVTGSPSAIWVVKDINGITVGSVELTAARHLVVKDVGGVVLASSEPWTLPSGGWNRIEIRFVASGTVGAIEVRAWEAPFSSGAQDVTVLATGANTGDFGLGQVLIGRARAWAASGAIGPLWFDALGTQTSTWLGPVAAPSGGAPSATMAQTLGHISQKLLGQASGSTVTTTGMYYVRLIAKDDDGAGPYSDPAVGGSTAQINTPDIAANAVTANEILAGSVTAEKLESVLLLSSKIATALLGQRVEIDPQGIRLYDQNEGLQVNLPTATGSHAEFTGTIYANGLPLIQTNGVSRCRAKRTSNQSIASSATVLTDEAIDWESTLTDTDDYWPAPTASNQTRRFILPYDGLYLINTRVVWEQATGGWRQSQLQVSHDYPNAIATWAGISYERKDAVTGNVTPVNLFVDYVGAAGDIIRLMVAQSTGGALLVANANMSIIYMGPGGQGG